MSIEDLNYYSDRRVTAVDERWWDAISGMEARLIDDYTESGTWVKVRFEVCPLCDGRGKHVNPSIDSNGLTADDFDEDPDFAEGYFGGAYDVRCNLCQGEKVVPVPLDEAVLARIEEFERERYESQQERLAEMRWGL